MSSTSIRGLRGAIMLQRFVPITVAIAAASTPSIAAPLPAVAPDSGAGANAQRGSGSVDELRREVAALTATVDQQAVELARLRAAQGEDWLTQERATEIRGIVSDVLADAESRASFQSDGATTGYSGGFFIASPDGNFKLVINGQMQARWALSRLTTRSLEQLDAGTYQPPATGPLFGFPGGTEIRGYQGVVGQAPVPTKRTASGFEMREVKLDFSGHVVDPSWQYRISTLVGQISNQTAFGTVASTNSQAGVQSAGPVAGNASAGPGSSGGLVGFEDIWVLKDFGGGWTVRVGQFKSPLLKEELVPSRFQLTTQRSLTCQFFSAKYTQGIELTHTTDLLRVMASFNDGGNNANTSAVIGNNGSLGTFTDWAVSGRAEVKLAGEWKQFNDMSSYAGESAAMYIGAAVNWQRGGGSAMDAVNNSWTTGGGANGALVASGATVFGSGIPIMVPAAALQYPNNIPTNANDAVTNLTWTVDSMAHLGGLSLYGAFIGNVAYDIPAGWVANPSGGYTPLAGTGNGPNIVPNNVSLIPGNGSNGGLSAFVPGYGYGNSPIFSYGLVAQAGWFLFDDLQIYGRYEWYTTLDNGQNGYAGNTASFWGMLPGGDSPLANNTQTNNAGAVPAGANTPSDAYVGGNTNPFYDFNLGANPYGAQMNSIVTLGAAWFPAGAKVKQLKVMGEVSWSHGPVLFQNGIYGQSANAADYRFDGGQPGGGQIVARLQVQLYF